MDRPRLRYIDAVPFEQEGRELILLKDAEGVIEQGIAVSRDVAFIVSLMDGSRTLRDIQADFMRASGEMVYMEQIENLVKILDQNLFLQGARYERHIKSMRDEYLTSPTRKAYLAGRSYPAQRMELLTYLNSMFDGCYNGTEAATDVSGILAPHIDYQRGTGVYRTTYPYLRGAARPLIVILGTCHRPTGRLWNISLKDFETPLETIPCGAGLKDLITGNEFLSGYVDEWPHRTEHSIELQLPLLQFVIEEDMEILPILTGSMHKYIDGSKTTEDGEIERLVSSLKDVLDAYGRPYTVLAAADLAHIGAQFGDSFDLDAPTLGDSRERDSELLRHIGNVDAESFFRAIQDEQDARRICGLAPIYFQLRMLEGSQSRIVGYDQWTDGRSSVSFAGAIFH